MRTFGALFLFVIAVALVFVRPGPALPALELLASRPELADLAERLREENRPVVALDVAACALAHGSPAQRTQAKALSDDIQRELAEADALPLDSALSMEDEAFWNWAGRVEVHALLTSRLASSMIERAFPANAPVASAFRRPSGAHSNSAAILIALERREGFSEPFAADLAARLQGGASVETALGDTWKGLWSICRNAGRLDRAAGILRPIQDEQGLRRAVIACGLAPDAPARLSAILAVAAAHPTDDTVAGECLYYIANRRLGALERLDGLHQAAARGPHALQFVQRGGKLEDLPDEAAVQSVRGGWRIDQQLANRVSERVGIAGFLALKFILIAALALPLGMWFTRRISSSRETRTMIKYAPALAIVLAAALFHLSSGRAQAQIADVDSDTAVRAMQSGGFASTTGWLWAVPLIAITAVLQFACVLKARGQAQHIAAGGENAGAALRYLRFYAEVPVFLGFLGSVVGAILLQLLAAGQMIYFAYGSTVTGLMAMLWVQHQYLIHAEVQLGERGENT